MKKWLTMILAAVCCFGAVSCSNQGNSAMKEYMPLLENTLYIYTSDNPYVESYSMYFDYVRDNKMQRRTIGTTEWVPTSVELLEVKENEVRLYRSMQNFYEHQDVTGLEPNIDSLILEGPLEVGHKWIQSRVQNPTPEDERAAGEAAASDVVAEITGMDVDVTTPAGSYKAMEVTLTDDFGYVNKQYYVKNIGSVKSVTKTGDAVSTTELSEIRENVSLDEFVKMYAPAMEGVEPENAPVSYKTNNDVVEVYNQLGRDYISKTYGFDLQENAKILSIDMDYDDFLLTVDVSKGVQEDLQKAPSEEKEREILQGIVNTFCDLYNAEEMILTVEGTPYDSGRVAFGAGETITQTVAGGVYFND